LQRNHRASLRQSATARFSDRTPLNTSS
jgi:hypothetical protein